MRSWRAPSGEVLIELDGIFHLLSKGVLTRSYAPSETSLDDWLYHQRYRVQDGGLWSDFSGERYGGAETSSSTLELGGLTELPEGDEPAVRRVLAAREEAQAQRAAARAEADARRLASFRAALPPRPAKLSFSFTYDGPDIVVRGPAGEELWRDATWEYLGRDLYRHLATVLNGVYGRPVHFAVEVEGEDALRFNPD